MVQAIQGLKTKLITISKLETVLTILPTVEEGIDRVFLHEIESDLTNKEE